MKAVILEVELSGDMINIIDKRKLSFKPEISARIESYNTSKFSISVLNEYCDVVKKYFEDRNCKVKNTFPVFRAKDYTYQSNPSYYNITVRLEELEYLLERYKKSYNLDFDPEFQRGYVWSDIQKVKYIEYLMSGASSGRNFYFNCPNWFGNFNPETEKMTVVDGKQRLSTLIDFFNNKIQIFGTAYYRDLLYYDKECLNFVFYVNNLTDEKEIVKWYISMNTGGTVHTDEDLKIAYDYIRKLNNRRDTK